ncbi:MAG: phospholipase D family protein [Niastella sp.]|nr:phospholipase D family protein [Niastella sp.]
MAKFLTTTAISYHLEELIKRTHDRLILISPYLQFNDRIKEHIENLNILKRDIRIIYRENKLPPDENNWLGKQIGVRTSICKNLHAKCYLNEAEAIITSMNLYEFSQRNNNEMGIYISKADDPDLYKATYEEATRLLTISEEIRVTVQKVSSVNDLKNLAAGSTSHNPKTGFCIRSGVPIPFNVEKPMSNEAYKLWSKFSNPDYPEKYCHFSGELSDGETSLNKPILKKNWKKAKEAFNL